MQIADGVAILATLLSTVTNAVAQASQVSSMIQAAQAAGRTTFTDTEWATITAANSASREALVTAIQKALAGN